jgi:hypothetical protein
MDITDRPPQLPFTMESVIEKVRLEPHVAEIAEALGDFLDK